MFWTWNVRGGIVTQLRGQLAQVIAANQSQQALDQIGAQLDVQCCVALAQAVRLTPAKRLGIIERVDHEAKMHGDSVAEAEAFLGRWRKARHLLYREGLATQPSGQVQAQMEQAGCAPQLVYNVASQLRASERRENFSRKPNLR